MHLVKYMVELAFSFHYVHFHYAYTTVYVVYSASYAILIILSDILRNYLSVKYRVRQILNSVGSVC